MRAHAFVCVCVCVRARARARACVRGQGVKNKGLLSFDDGEGDEEG